MNPTALKVSLPTRLQRYAGEVTHAALAQDAGRDFDDPLQAVA